MISIEHFKNTQIKEYIDKPFQNDILYIDKSWEDTFNAHLYFFDSSDESDYFIIPGYDIPKNKISFDEYLEFLRLLLLNEVFAEDYFNIFDKYTYLFKEFTNEDGLYSSYAALHLLILSDEVSLEEKELLYFYKMNEYNIDQKELEMNLDNKEEFFVNQFISQNQIVINELDKFYNEKKGTINEAIANGKHSIRILSKMGKQYEDKDLSKFKESIFYSV